MGISHTTLSRYMARNIKRYNKDDYAVVRDDLNVLMY